MKAFDKVAEEDALERGQFVQQIYASLVSDQFATELVVAVTGEWGSGKSTILDQLSKFAKGNGVQVFKFVPWMVLNEDALVRSFLEGLASKTAVNKKDWRRHFRKLAKYLIRFTNNSAPFMKNVFDDFLDQTLDEVYENFKETFKKSQAPILVLVDELDRLTDQEIKTVFRMIKAIGDLPNVSYLLAFDKKRISDALSISDSETSGVSYLEKIVQLEFTLPYLAPNRACLFLEGQLKQASNGTIDDILHRDRIRFDTFLSYAVPQLISTPRDMKRLAYIWNARWNSLKDEADWLDLLGFCLLELKVPQAVNFIRDDPGAFASNGVSRMHSHFLSGAMGKKEERSHFKSVNDFEALIETQQVWDEATLRSLLLLLWPDLEGSGPEVPSEKSKSIRNLDVLNTVLTYGQPDQTIRLIEVRNFVAATAKERSAAIEKWHKHGELYQFFCRLCDAYEDMRISDPIEFWRGFFEAFENLSLNISGTADNYRLVNAMERRVSRLFERTSSLKAVMEEIISEAIDGGSYNLASVLLWDAKNRQQEQSNQSIGIDRLLESFQKKAVRIHDDRTDKLEKVFSMYFFLLVYHLDLLNCSNVKLEYWKEREFDQHIIHVFLLDHTKIEKELLEYFVNMNRASDDLLANHRHYNILEDPNPTHWSCGLHLAYRRFLSIASPEKFEELINKHR